MQEEPICKLSGERGKFVRSHLIPEALTEAGGPDGPMHQHGRGARPVRRWTSWYDEQLVTAAGEKILADYDNWAIGVLRRHKLVWSSWGPMQRLSTKDHRLLRCPLNSGWGLRQVQLEDSKRLRLFFLSLLWRAAETSRWEFEEVSIEKDPLSLLKSMVLAGDPKPLDLFPVELIQLSSRGFNHNHTPVAMEKEIPAVDKSGPTLVPIFRFYFDGLVVHFDRRKVSSSEFGAKSQLYVGCSDELTVTTVPFDGSFQRGNLIQVMADELRAHASTPLPPRGWG